MEYSGNYDDVNGLYEEALDLATIDDEECIRCYDEIIGINSGEGMAWRGKGLALGRLGRPQEAIQCYDKALEINPENDHALTMKDQLTNLVDERASLEYKIQEGLEESIDDPEERERLRRNLENFADPENAFMEGMRFFQLKNFKEAIPYLKKAKSSPEVDGMLGMCLRNIQNYDESITYFDKALSVEPENDMFLNLKGYSLRDLERWDEYVTIQTKLLKINPLDDHALYSKGIGLTELSKYDEAFFCYDKALEINSDDEVVWFNKGEALEKLSKYSESISCYEKGFEINPEDPDISDWSSDDGTAMQSLDAVKAKLSKESSSETAEKVEVIEKSEPLDVLKMRLAKGEITLEEFNEIKKNLV